MSDYSSYDSLLEVVKKRRSIRQFKPDPIPEDYIDKIIEVARWAPSGFHTQPWEFVVVTDSNLRDKITKVLEFRPPRSNNSNTEDRPGTTETASRRPYFSDAPVFIILLGDWRAKVGLPGSPEDQTRRVDNVFCSSLAGAFLYMHLAAASLGLASCWVSASSSGEQQQQIKNLLGIPEPLRIYDMMAVGYSTQTPIAKVIRNKKDIIHHDYCGVEDFRSDEKVISDAKESQAWCMAAH